MIARCGRQGGRGSPAKPGLAFEDIFLKSTQSEVSMQCNGEEEVHEVVIAEVSRWFVFNYNVETETED